jgi:hypothetical protein
VPLFPFTAFPVGLQSTRVRRPSFSTAKLETEQLKNRFSDIAIFAATREDDNILILRR